MLLAIGQLLPLGLAAALSSVPVTTVLTILLSRHSPAPAVAFMAGYLLGLLVVAGAFALGVRAVPADTAAASAAVGGVVLMVLGIGLLGYAGFLARRHGTGQPSEELPRWLRAVGAIRPVPAFGLALALNLRPKALLLAATLGLVIGTGHLGVVEATVLVLGYAALGGSTVGTPVVLTLARPEAMQQRLETAARWIARNNRTMTAIVLLVVGVVVFAGGLARL